MSKKASKIKITVIDPENDKKVRIPAIYFGFISFMASSALLFKPLILKNRPLDDEAIKVIDLIDREMIREILDELKSYGPFDLVDISSDDGTKVKISTL